MPFDIDYESLADIARGAAILGTGGGGDPLVGRLLVEQALSEGLRIQVLDPTEVNDDDLIVATAMMGAPSVVVEKLPNGHEAVDSLRRLEERLGRRADCTIPMECGGLNSMIPLLVAARADIPVIDGDGMGRAFPELQMETFGVYGVSGSPLAVSDADGYTALIETGHDNQRMESFARAVTIRMGGASYIAEYPMTGRDLKRTAIPGTLSLARSLGRAVREARHHHDDPFRALIRVFEDSIYQHAHSLMTGKIIDVERAVQDGFTTGQVTIASFHDDHRMTIRFRNENTIACLDGRTVALVPDLITVFDLESAAAINSEALRYGQRVRVLGISTPAIMRTPEALAIWGPHAFGISEEWTPLEALQPSTVLQH